MEGTEGTGWEDTAAPERGVGDVAGPCFVETVEQAQTRVRTTTRRSEKKEMMRVNYFNEDVKLYMYVIKLYFRYICGHMTGIKYNV